MFDLLLCQKHVIRYIVENHLIDWLESSIDRLVISSILGKLEKGIQFLFRITEITPHPVQSSKTIIRNGNELADRF